MPVLIDRGSLRFRQMLLLLLMLLCLCQRSSSDGRIIIRLDTYRNPNSVLSDGNKCDTFGSASPCDMKFTVSYTVGSASQSPYCVSGEFPNALEVNNFCPTPIDISFTGAFPISANNWQVRVEVFDIDLTPDEKVDDFSLNELLDPPTTSIRSASFNGSPPAGFTTVTTNLRHAKSITWSYQLYCSAHYYSGLCDKYCKPEDSINGHYTCTASGDKECLLGYWDPATNCKNTYCTGTTLCLNGGLCNALIDGYSCNCASTNFTGRHCEIPRNPCTYNAPCRNGTCSNPSDGVYTCACHPGYRGTNCEFDIDECAGGATGCNLIGTENCTNLIGSFNCKCRDGWSGPYCRNISDYCLALRPCLHGNCSNGNGSMGSNYTCSCHAGWKGPNCDQDVDECAEAGASPCYENGTEACVNLNGTFACNCKPGWTGSVCNNMSDYCLAMKPACYQGNCVNNGSSGYACVCNSGWEGAACDRDIDECAGGANGCNLAGTDNCTNLNGSFNCVCKEGWSGSKCKNMSDYCLAMKPACHHGNCVSNGSSSYACVCNSGWEGAACDRDIDECGNPAVYCVNQRSCANTEGSYVCVCQPGFEGPRCDTRNNPCLHQRPCAHGNCTPVTTSSGPNSDYACACNTGWEGRNCTADKNECKADSNPCSEGETCVNLLGGYRCDPPAASYWWVALIIVLILLLAAAAIVVWRLLVCRQRKLLKLGRQRGSADQASSAPTVNVRPGNLKWPNDDRATLDDWSPAKYNYEIDNKSPRLPPRNTRPPAPQPPSEPPLDADAEYELIRTVTTGQGQAARVHHSQLDDTGTYDELRHSKMLGTGEAPQPLNETGPKPPLPRSPRPLHKKLAQQSQPAASDSSGGGGGSGGVDSEFESAYDNSGYLSSEPVSRPVSNPGYLDMTNDPNGYVRPNSLAIDSSGYARPISIVIKDQQAAAQALPHLPPKPQKIKRRKPKTKPPPPPPPAKPTENTDGAPVDVPEIHIIDAYGEDAGPLTASLNRLNSQNASESL